MRRTRLNVFLEAHHAKRLAELATIKDVSKSAIVGAALASLLAAGDSERPDAVLLRRLDRLTRQLDKLERDQNILIETVSLYVRYYLSVTPPVPEGQQDAARAQGKARFQQFIEQLGRHLQRGNSLVQDVHQELFPDASGLGNDEGVATEQGG